MTIRVDGEFVWISKKIRLPLSIADRIPSNLPWPENWQMLPLVIFERCSSYDGQPYEWRFIAPRNNTFLDIENLNEIVGCEVEGNEAWICGCGPILISTIDGITITYDLPCGSMEYVNGQWVLQNPDGLCAIKYDGRGNRWRP